MFERIPDNYKNLSLALGFFDGVHRAHRKVILNAVEYAKQNGIKSAVITFNTHPAEAAGKQVKYITTIQTRDELIKSLGVDYIFSIDFDKNLMDITHTEYLDALVNKFNPQAITTGFNHTFGKARLGTSGFLEENSKKYGYEYFLIKPETLNGEVISSSVIRKKLAAGDISLANEMLGHSFSFGGKVIYGNQIGRTIGFPTANIIYPEELVTIPYGVYAVRITVKNETHKGMMNFGIKPTIDETNKIPVAEVHILNFDDDIYGEAVNIDIEKQIRTERKFPSLEELKKQIEKDLMSC